MSVWISSFQLKATISLLPVIVLGEDEDSFLPSILQSLTHVHRDSILKILL